MVTVPKSDATTQAPGSWWHDTWGDGEGAIVVLCCPSGDQGTLHSRRAGNPDSDHHTIAADGAVSPSVVCPRAGCTYHEFVRLLDWDGFKPV